MYPSQRAGFALTELLVTVFVVGVATVAVTGLALLGSRTSFETERQVVALALVNETLEMIRSLPYQDVGYTTPTSVEPDGVLVREQEIERNQQPYTLLLGIELVDDPENGLLEAGVLNEGTADYKKVKVAAVWTTASGNYRDDVFAVAVISKSEQFCTPGDAYACPGAGPPVAPGAPIVKTDCPASGVCPSYNGSSDPDATPSPTPSVTPTPTPEGCPIGAVFCPPSPTPTAVITPTVTPSPPACAATADCASGFVCLEGPGICVDNCSKDTVKCPTGEQCSATTGLCSAPPAPVISQVSPSPSPGLVLCSSDFQCAQYGMTCGPGGTCQDDTLFDPCSSDSECSGGLSCIAGACQGSWCQPPGVILNCTAFTVDPGCFCPNSYGGRFLTESDGGQTQESNTDPMCNTNVREICSQGSRWEACPACPDNPDAPPQCSDGVDNDSDGGIDQNDASCYVGCNLLGQYLPSRDTEVGCADDPNADPPVTCILGPVGNGNFCDPWSSCAGNECWQCPVNQQYCNENPAGYQPATEFCAVPDSNPEITPSAEYQIGICGECSTVVGSFTCADTNDVCVNGQCVPTCSDGVDNDDVDDLIDEEDPGCYTNLDIINGTYNPEGNENANNIANPPWQCSDGVDNDDPEDTLRDSEDPACHTDYNANNPNSFDPYGSYENNRQCDDGIDNDSDGLADINDPSCHTDYDRYNSASYDRTKDNEADTNWNGCTDGIDNDGDGFIDSQDRSCHVGYDLSQPFDAWAPFGEDNPACDNNYDDDGDGLTDENDPDCHSDRDIYNEASYVPGDFDEGCDYGNCYECSDGIDNDGDGAADRYDIDCHASPGNPDTWQATDSSYKEAYECNDGNDNDGNGLSDENDPGCYGNWDRFGGEYNERALEYTPSNLNNCANGIDDTDPEDTLADRNDPQCTWWGYFDPYGFEEASYYGF